MALEEQQIIEPDAPRSRRGDTLCTRVWTEERIALLKKLWADGVRASHIAARLGGTTRNAVIAKAHRLGVSHPCGVGPRKRVLTTKQRRHIAGFKASGEAKRKRRAPPEGAAFRSAGLAIPKPRPEDIGRKLLVDLDNRDCRWPCKDAAPSSTVANQTFCAEKAVPGLSYCRAHARRAYPTRAL